MADDIRRWVTEFLLRSSEVDDLLLKRVLSVIDASDWDFRLKKAALLKAVECEILGNTVTEHLLEIFEIIEQFDKDQGHTIPESLKAAYCAVAVECTMVFFPVRGIGKQVTYSEAVSNIWSGRVTELETAGKSELVSPELKATKKELEATLSDGEGWKKLVKLNTKYQALKRTHDYLIEARASLGQPFLEFAATVEWRETSDGQTTEGQETTQVQTLVATEVEVLDNPGPSQGVSESVAMEVEVLDNPSSSRGVSESVAMEVELLDNPSPSRGVSGKPLASHRRVRAAKISHPVDLENDVSSEKYTCLHTPEVNRAREALKASTLELQAVVKDPLPDALRIAESVAHDLAQKNKISEHSMEDQNGAGASNPVITKGALPLQSVSSASASEQNNSIDKVSRLHLPSPKRKNVSPLKKYVDTKFVRRRTRRNWSLLEEDTLRTAVQKYGKGNWKLILNAHRDVFEERTDVDLKDKWRNMTR